MRAQRVLSRSWNLARERSSIIWLALLSALLVVFITRSEGEIDRTIAIIRNSSVSWLLAAVLTQIVIVFGFILVLALILTRLGHRLGWAVLVQAYFHRAVVGALTPVSGPASTFAFTRHVGSRGVPTDDALLALALNGVVGYGSFVFLLIPVLVFLELQHRVSLLLLVGATILMVVFLLLVIGVYLLLHGTAPPAWIENRVPERARAFAREARRHQIQPGDLAWPFLTACLVEAFGVILLYACLRAVGQEPTIATALTAYAVGTTFAIVSPFFSGIGLVELGMVVALSEFGIPDGSALAATLLYRAAEFWLPLLFGLSLQVGSRQEVRRLSVHIPAALTFFSGLSAVLSVLAPTMPQRLNRIHDYPFLTVPAFSRSFVVVSGFFLMVLSYNLWRGKRVAWIAAVVLLAASIPAHLIKHHDELVAIPATFTLALLLIHRHRFTVRSDVPTMRQGLYRFVLSLLFALAYGTVGFFLIDRRAFGIDFNLIDAATRTLRGFFSLGDTGLTPQTSYASWFLDSLTIIGVTASAYAVFSLARPVVWRRTVHEQERQRARQLISAYGDSSLDFFKYLDDKLFFFASNGCGVVSYGLAHDTAVSLGDPVAETDADFALVLSEFLDFCASNGWRPAFHQASPHRLAAYRAAGLSAIKIGEDAIVDLDTFTLSGGAMKSLRTHVNRVEREGYRLSYYLPPQTAERLAALHEVSDEWLKLGGHRERGFTLGQFEDDYIRNSPIFTVEAANGQIAAFANLIPDGVKGEATIDLMRRRAHPDDVMDYLFLRAFEHLKSEGYHRFSLGMAPFANVGTEQGARVPERIVGQLYEHGNRLFSYKGLRSYKDKFHPCWETRYLVYRSEFSLPTIALAIVRLTE